MLIMLYLGRRRPVVGQCPNLALDPSLCLHLPLLRVENIQPFLACDLSDTISLYVSMCRSPLGLSIICHTVRALDK